MLKVAAFLAASALGATAHAGGLGRPNSISARAVSWGGAFTAVADDPTALHFNPAGMALQDEDTVLAGTETIAAPRSYTPLNDDGTMGDAQKPINKPAFLPVLGFVTRLHQDGMPSRWALGVGFWNTFGGALEYEKGDPSARAINSTQIALLELVPGLAYEVNDFLQIGFALRLGFGLFDVNATRHPTASAEVSTSGVGAGVSLGVMVAPGESRALRIGAVWRSAITVNTKGKGLIDFGDGIPKNVDASLEQTWPQQASLALHWQATASFGLAAQADWTDWSRMQRLTVVAAGATDVNRLDFNDSYALHLGAEIAVSKELAVRAGYTFDSNAVPDRTIQRDFLDGPKHAVGTGLSWVVRRWWTIDVAAEVVAGPVRHVPNNDAEYADFPARANVAPGDHEGQIYTLELGMQFRY